ncbi:MAG TPA: hypothetical protein VKU90_16460 [Caulobacteraceae bacterium]|nr:hypothetical protein [Caulobacteraceae bacterium]
MKPQFSLAALLAAVALGACHRAPAPANTATPSAAPPVSTAAASAPAPPAGGETPTAFVTRVLASYQPNGQQWANTGTEAADAAQQAWLQKYEAEVYDPDFLKLVNDNSQLAADKSGGMDLDYDPFCQCQGAGAIYSVVSAHADGARYDVVVKSDEKQQGPWTFVLTRSGAGWRVFDVLEQTGRSVRATLTQHNACLRAAKTETEGDKCVSN